MYLQILEDWIHDRIEQSVKWERASCMLIFWNRVGYAATGVMVNDNRPTNDYHGTQPTALLWEYLILELYQTIRFYNELTYYRHEVLPFLIMPFSYCHDGWKPALANARSLIRQWGCSVLPRIICSHYKIEMSPKHMCVWNIYKQWTCWTWIGREYSYW